MRVREVREKSGIRNEVVTVAAFHVDRKRMSLDRKPELAQKKMGLRLANPAFKHHKELQTKAFMTSNFKRRREEDGEFFWHIEHLRMR